MQRYAGIVSERFSSVNFKPAIPSNIKNPTKINAGAVAKEGIDVNNGENNVARRNKTAVVSAVRPVRLQRRLMIQQM